MRVCVCLFTSAVCHLSFIVISIHSTCIALIEIVCTAYKSFMWSNNKSSRNSGVSRLRFLAKIIPVNKYEIIKKCFKPQLIIKSHIFSHYQQQCNDCYQFHFDELKPNTEIPNPKFPSIEIKFNEHINSYNKQKTYTNIKILGRHNKHKNNYNLDI